jgi:hypothetical protein
MSGLGGRVFAFFMLGGMGVTFFMLANVVGGVLGGFGFVFGALLSVLAVMALFGRVARRKAGN